MTKTISHPYISYKESTIELDKHDHQYCINCRKVMIYNKSNGLCWNCDTGIPKKNEQLVRNKIKTKYIRSIGVD
jgi:hypothetical protein